MVCAGSAASTSLAKGLVSFTRTRCGAPVPCCCAETAIPVATTRTETNRIRRRTVAGMLPPFAVREAWTGELFRNSRWKQHAESKAGLPSYFWEASLGSSSVGSTRRSEGPLPFAFIAVSAGVLISRTPVFRSVLQSRRSESLGASGDRLHSASDYVHRIIALRPVQFEDGQSARFRAVGLSCPCGLDEAKAVLH
jgi:hypothetical protein